jgi:hypothetical protein
MAAAAAAAAEKEKKKIATNGKAMFKSKVRRVQVAHKAVGFTTPAEAVSAEAMANATGGGVGRRSSHSTASVAGIASVSGIASAVSGQYNHLKYSLGLHIASPKQHPHSSGQSAQDAPPAPKRKPHPHFKLDMPLCSTFKEAVDWLDLHLMRHADRAEEVCVLLRLRLVAFASCGVCVLLHHRLSLICPPQFRSAAKDVPNNCELRT